MIRRPVDAGVWRLTDQVLPARLPRLQIYLLKHSKTSGAKNEVKKLYAIPKTVFEFPSFQFTRVST